VLADVRCHIGVQKVFDDMTLVVAKQRAADAREGPLTRRRVYGQSRGVIPFSCAYFAAEASTRGRTRA
jgi:hypothetical protein